MWGLCVHVCMCRYVHSCTCICMSMHVCMCIYVPVCTCAMCLFYFACVCHVCLMYICVHVHLCICFNVLCVLMHVYVYAKANIYVDVHICVEAQMFFPQVPSKILKLKHSASLSWSSHSRLTSWWVPGSDHFDFIVTEITNCTTYPWVGSGEWTHGFTLDGQSHGWLSLLLAWMLKKKSSF